MQGEFGSAAEKGYAQVESDQIQTINNVEIAGTQRLSATVNMSLSALEVAIRRSFVEAHQYLAHKVHLHLAVEAFESGRNASNVEIANLIKIFISQQSESADKCSAQVLEAKQQRNQLHVMIGDIAGEINATESDIGVAEQLLSTKSLELEEAKNWKSSELFKCAAEMNERRAMLATLRKEMEELKQITDANVTMDIQTGKMNTGIGLFDLTDLEASQAGGDSHVGQRPEHNFLKVGKLVNRTRRAVEEMAKCIKQTNSHTFVKGSLLQFLQSRSLTPHIFHGNLYVDSACGCAGYINGASAADAVFCRTVGKGVITCMPPNAFDGKCPGEHDTCIARVSTATTTMVSSSTELTNEITTISPTIQETTAEATSKTKTTTATRTSAVLREANTPCGCAGYRNGASAADRVLCRKRERGVITCMPPNSGDGRCPRDVDICMTIASSTAATTVSATSTAYTTTKTTATTSTQTTTARTFTTIVTERTTATATTTSGALGTTARAKTTDDTSAEATSTSTSGHTTTKEDIRNNNSFCEQQQKILEDTFAETLTDLSRSISEFEHLVTATACEESTCDRFDKRIVPIREEVTNMISQMRAKVDHLKALRPRLDDARNAEEHLSKQVVDLTEECAFLPETLSNLQKMRDAIVALGTCPNLEVTTFHIPTWVGRWVQVEQNPTASDATLDWEMQRKCEEEFSDTSHPVRVAEMGEIEAMSIKNLPLRNTAPVPLIGACPMCAGDSDEGTSFLHADGHARVCWDSEALLDQVSARRSCSHGFRVFPCVYLLSPRVDQKL